MINLRAQGHVLAIAALLTASLGLGGCVTLFPKTRPAQLYRFGENVGSDAGQQPSAPAILAPPLALRLSTGFTRSAEADRMLTSSGEQSGYIAQSRWVSPASVLFEEAASRAFEAPGSPFRLMRSGDVGASNTTLRLEVETFEADYAPGWSGPPTVVVRVRAMLTQPTDHGLPTAAVFESRQAAGENRVSAIVTAYDAATTETLKQVVSWTTAQTASASVSQ